MGAYPGLLGREGRVPDHRPRGRCVRLLLIGRTCMRGWLVWSKVLTLGRRHIDLEAGTIRLEPGSTKNDEGRLVYLTPALAAGVTAQLERVRALERKLGCVTPGSCHVADGPLHLKRAGGVTLSAIASGTSAGRGLPGDAPVRLPPDRRAEPRERRDSSYCRPRGPPGCYRSHRQA